MTGDLITEKNGQVRVLRMNRPHARNALSLAMRKAISAAIIEGDRDPETRVVVITGSETCFSAGGDIKEFPDAAGREDSSFVSQRIWAPLSSCRVPLIAAVEGIALGGGAEFAMLCDIVIAGETAEFAFPEVRLGILPGNGGTQRFPRAAGKFKAMRYLLTGDRFSARDASEMGLSVRLSKRGRRCRRRSLSHTGLPNCRRLLFGRSRMLSIRAPKRPLRPLCRLSAKAAAC